MKLRIYKLPENGQYVIEKRIFHFLLIEWWVRYIKYAPISFNTLDQAKERMAEILEKKRDKENNQGKEILRYTV